jgi:hypothetical protein
METMIKDIPPKTSTNGKKTNVIVKVATSTVNIIMLLIGCLIIFFIVTACILNFDNLKHSVFGQSKEEVEQNILSSMKTKLTKEGINCDINDFTIIKVGKNQYKGMATFGHDLKIEIEITSDNENSMWSISGPDMLSLKEQCSE